MLKIVSSSVTRKYEQYSSLISADKDVALYFLRETEGERYELLFGDGVFGVELEEPNEIIVNYLSCSGAAPNGLSSFSFAGRLKITTEIIDEWFLKYHNY